MITGKNNEQSKENAELNKLLSKNIESFTGLWPDGYCEGDPLDPISMSQGYAELGYMSVLHVVYLACIKPYINEETVVLEIGPGRGAWTKTFLKAKEIWCQDIRSAEENKFWEHVGKAANIKYIKVNDFSCSNLPENKFNYFFSFGTFCHIPFGGIKEYMKNLYPKFTHGTHCFLMIMDYEKFNSAWQRKKELSIYRILNSGKKKYIKNLIDFLHEFRMFYSSKYRNKYTTCTYREMDKDNIPRPGRLYHAGIKQTCKILEEIGYQIIDPDMCVLHRDPMLHFIKP